MALLAWAAYCLLASQARPRKWAEMAAALLALIAMALLALGYDLKVGWSFLEEASIVACISAFLLALVRYGRRQLAAGE
jgi:TRAP-type C4-dicarboxylate transport system permease large subunit